MSTPNEELYTSLQAKWQSFGIDTSSPFLVEGDSLLINVLNHPFVKQDFASAKRLPQLLAIFYQVEQWLAKLPLHQRTFEVAFFDQVSGAFKSERLQFLRAVLKKHLRENTNVEVVEFSSLSSPEFEHYVTTKAPQFIMIGDGKISEPAYIQSGDFVENTELIFKSLTLESLKYGVICARMTEMAFHNSGLYTFELKANRLEDLSVDTFFTEGMLPPPASGDGLAFDAALFDKIVSQVATIAQPLNTEPSRLTLTAYAIARIITKANAAKCMALLLQAILLEVCPLPVRFQAVDEKELEAAADAKFTTAIFHESLAALQSAMADKLQAKSLLDMVDGRLFHVVQQLVVKGDKAGVKQFGLRRSSHVVFTQIWALVSNKILALPKFLANAPAKEAEDVLVKESTSAFSKAEVAQEAAEVAQVEEEKAEKEEKNVVFSGKKKEVVEEEDWGEDSGSEGFGDWDATSSDEEGAEDDTPAKPAAKKAAAPKDDEKEKVHDDTYPAFKRDYASAEVVDMKKMPMVNALVGQLQGVLEKSKSVKVVDKKPNVQHAALETWQSDVFCTRNLLWVPPKDKWEKRNADRFVAFMQKYVVSLKGGGLVVFRDVVLAAPPPAVKKDKNFQKKSKKPKKLTQKEKTQAAVTAKQQLEQKEKVDRHIAVASSLKNLDLKIDYLDTKMLSHGDPTSAIPGLLQLLDWCVLAWKQSDKTRGDIDRAVQLFRTAHDIFRRFLPYITPEIVVVIREGLTVLGFEDSANTLLEKYLTFKRERGELNSEDEKKASAEINTNLYREYNVKMTSARFQLKHTGPIMVRDVESAYDGRVSGFYPDKWQRRLLDIVDDKESALVCAPTSSGKTFISYYCMKQVLLKNKVTTKATEKGFVVYVLPTKALVNQICADVYQRYGPVYGSYYRGFVYKPLECQVLVTVPDCLEYLLLDPVHEQWCSQIKYVIFDEVHSIGQADNDGPIWERVIQLIKCPFLALSATVGNPDVFYDWMQRVQNAHNRKIHKVIHPTRWSDLEKYFFLPQTVDYKDRCTITDIRKYKLPMGSKLTVPIHPCVALNPGMGLDTFNVEDGFPRTVAFSPSDSLELYDAMEKVIEAADVKDSVKESFLRLKPETYFFGNEYIPKKDADKYAEAIKDELSAWNKDGHHDLVGTVFSNLSEEVYGKIIHMEKIFDEEFKSKNSAYSAEYLKKNFLPLVLDLHGVRKLPAVIFCLDRDMCEQLVVSACEELELQEAETLNREETPEVKKEKERKKKEMENAAKAAAKAAASMKAAKKKNDDDDGDDYVPIVMPEEPAEDPRFTFMADFSSVREDSSMDRKEYEYWLDRLLWKTKWTDSHPLVRAMFRGMGVHHAGLPRAYLDTIETLFRAKHIRIVVATATLAVGINMPCRTVVFAGDYGLTPLLYGQMSGRAGRRGYDDVGHVVFFGVQPQKAFRMIKSPLSNLDGYFGMTTTLALRLLAYYSRAKDKGGALEAARAIMSTPFTSDPKDAALLSHQAHYHFMFSCNYLYRKGLIDAEGNPIGMANMLLYITNADDTVYNFITVYQAGIIQKICANFKKDRKGVATRLLEILAHFYQRVPISGSRLTNIKKEKTVYDTAADEYKSLITLNPLPDHIKKLTDQHNAETVQFYKDYIRTFSREELESRDIDNLSTTPLSNLPFPPKKERPVLNEAFSKTWVGDLFQHCAGLDNKLRSPFVGLSGVSDKTELNSVEEIAATTHQKGMRIETLTTPSTNQKNMHMEDIPLNAYALDFFAHGHMSWLITQNNLPETEVWTMLNDWVVFLGDMLRCLEQIIVNNSIEPLEFIDNKRRGYHSDPVCLAFLYLRDEFKRTLSESLKAHLKQKATK